MKFQILAMTTFCTLFSYSTTYADCQMSGINLEPNIDIESSIKRLQRTVSSLSVTTNKMNIKECIEKTYELERMGRHTKSYKELFKYYERVLESHNRQKERILSRINRFQAECDAYETNCNSASYHRKKLSEELTEENNTKLEIAGYINEAVQLKKDERKLRASFDTDCVNKDYDRVQIMRICRKDYNYEFPICRDFM